MSTNTKTILTKTSTTQTIKYQLSGV